MDNGEGDPGPGNRASTLSDNLVTSGIINQDVGDMEATLLFDRPVVNRAGHDIIWFEINPGSTGDLFDVRINGVTRPSIGSVFQARTATQQPDIDLFESQESPVTSLANLENSDFDNGRDIGVKGSLRIRST